MQDELIILEKAKNGSYTCRYNISGKWRYLYSKYEPNKVIEDFSINDYVEFIIVLGLGLGYELCQIKKLTSKPIIVIESDQSFYNKMKECIPEVTTELLEGVKLYFGDDYKQVNLDMTRGQIISNNNLIQCNIQYYNKVIKHFYSKRSIENVICMFEHPTILNDCADAFKELGYKIFKLTWSHENTLLRNVAKLNPNYLFTINFSKIVAEISKTLNIPYISWTVDTPAYSLYSLENLHNDLSFFFVYDERVVQDLRNKGIKNIFYMPVAANIKRLEGIVVTNEDYEKYDAEIAFVGNSGVYNEFSTYIKPNISTALYDYISQLIKQQLATEQFIIKDLIDEALIERIESESKYLIDISNHTLLSRIEKLAFLLGRYHSYIERVLTINELSEKFDIKVYGDDRWLESREFKYSSLIYKGHAEHYNEMAKVFKVAKMNLNITRAFVETGLPMRVFDVLGSKGFLVTNNKYDISRYFRDGRDLVVYRDLKDLEEIIKYYLEHDDERRIIKQQGFETIGKNHTYHIRIKKMMEIVTLLIEKSKKGEYDDIQLIR